MGVRISPTLLAEVVKLVKALSSRVRLQGVCRFESCSQHMLLMFRLWDYDYLYFEELVKVPDSVDYTEEWLKFCAGTKRRKLNKMYEDFIVHLVSLGAERVEFEEVENFSAI